MLKLYLIRHGETSWNSESKTQGCKNIQLSDKGILQGRLLAEKLKSSDDEFKKVFSSDLDRCYLTAKSIDEVLNLGIEINKGFREMSFGDWEGLTIDEIKRTYLNEYTKWRNEPCMATIPRGEGLKTVQKRCLDALENIFQRYNDGSIIIVSHGVAIKTMILGLLGLDLKHFYSLSIGNASMNKIEFRDYGPVITNLNDSCHLQHCKIESLSSC